MAYVPEKSGASEVSTVNAGHDDAALTPQAAPIALAKLARHFSALNGEPNPTDLAYIAGSRQQAATLMGTSLAADAPSYIVEAHGHFTSSRGHARGAAAPTGTTMLIVVDAATGAITDWALGNTLTSLPAVAQPIAL